MIVFKFINRCMASSSYGISIPASEAVQVLVSSLADESPLVREASMASLKDIAALGRRRRFGNMAGIFQVMAFGVRALDKKDIDPAFMAKLSKIATAKMISSKELNADWQRAASTLLVSIGSHLSDLRKQNTVTRDKKETEFIARGRHDICVVPRAVPMVGAMVALVLVDQLMAQYA